MCSSPLMGFFQLIVKVYLSVYNSVSSRLPLKHSILHDAIKSGQVEKVAELFESCRKNGADLNIGATNSKGWSGLHIAASLGYTDIVAYLVENGFSINETTANSSRDTALHVAAAKDMQWTVEWILQNGGDPNAMNAEGQCPVHVASANNSGSAVVMLLKYGASPFRKDFGENTPAQLASGGKKSADNKLVKFYRDVMSLGTKEAVHKWLGKFRDVQGEARRIVSSVVTKTRDGTLELTMASLMDSLNANKKNGSGRQGSVSPPHGSPGSRPIVDAAQQGVPYVVTPLRRRADTSPLRVREYSLKG